MLQSSDTEAKVLSLLDAAPAEVINEHGHSEFLLVCEHAGTAIPLGLGDLGLTPAEMARHIAYDIGAEGVARQLSELLDAPLVLQRYSRLIVDCNRPFEAPDCFPAVSDGTRVPANTGLTEREKRRRFKEIHRPFHAMLSALLDRRAEAGTPTVLVAVHSFTTQLVGGARRPWELGVLSNRDSSFARRFLTAFQARHPDIPSAHNQPYIVDDLSDYTIPVHGEARGLSHLLLEIRNDLIADEAGQSRWARLVADTLAVANSDKGDTADGR